MIDKPEIRQAVTPISGSLMSFSAHSVLWIITTLIPVGVPLLLRAYYLVANRHRSRMRAPATGSIATIASTVSRSGSHLTWPVMYQSPGDPAERPLTNMTELVDDYHHTNPRQLLVSGTSRLELHAVVTQIIQSLKRDPRERREIIHFPLTQLNFRRSMRSQLIGMRESRDRPKWRLPDKPVIIVFEFSASFTEGRESLIVKLVYEITRLQRESNNVSTLICVPTSVRELLSPHLDLLEDSTSLTLKPMTNTELREHLDSKVPEIARWADILRAFEADFIPRDQYAFPESIQAMVDFFEQAPTKNSPQRETTSDQAPYIYDPSKLAEHPRFDLLRNRRRRSAHRKNRLNLVEAGDSEDTLNATAALANGLEDLFTRLGIPPEGIPASFGPSLHDGGGHQ